MDPTLSQAAEEHEFYRTPLPQATPNRLEMTPEPDLRYPIGPFTAPAAGAATAVSRAGHIAAIHALPSHMRAAVKGLDDRQLDTPYRPGGWSVRQVVHHVADSHVNAFVRIKLALTEDAPTIKPYDEVEWAKLADARLPIDVSLRLLDAVHERWAAVLGAMEPADYARRFVHPEAGEHDLDWLVAQYDWHGRHHVAHITRLREREGWS